MPNCNICNKETKVSLTCGSCSAKERIKKFGIPFKNKKHSIESINKIKASLLLIRKKTKLYYCKCGKEVSSKHTKQCQACFLKRLHKDVKRIIKICIEKRGCTKGKNNGRWIGGWKNKLPKCNQCGKQLAAYSAKLCRSCASKGELNPNYITGLNRCGYSFKFNKELKLKIRKRDNYTCQKCDKKESELKGFHKKLTVHHIDYNKQNCKEDNLITLCKECNIKANTNRKYWKLFYNSKMF